MIHFNWGFLPIDSPQILFQLEGKEYNYIEII